MSNVFTKVNEDGVKPFESDTLYEHRESKHICAQARLSDLLIGASYSVAQGRSKYISFPAVNNLKVDPRTPACCIYA